MSTYERHKKGKTPVVPSGIEKRDYHIPAGAKNVSVTVTKGTTDRTWVDTAKDRLPGLIGKESISLGASAFLNPPVAVGLSAGIFVYDLVSAKDRIPDAGHYQTYTVVVAYDKADEVSGEMIHFYRQTTYLEAYTSDKTAYLWRDDCNYYACRTCILGG